MPSDRTPGDMLPPSLAELANILQWVAWKRYPDPKHLEKPRKVPRTHDDKSTGADEKHRDTWSTYSEVHRGVMARPGLSGVGFVFTARDQYVGVDLDKCGDRATGQLEPWAQAIVDRLNSYTEWSVSGTGLHILCRGVLPQNGSRRGRVEMYDHDRYFTVTGWGYGKWGDLPITERTDALAAVHAEHVAPPAPTVAPVPVATRMPSSQTDDDLWSRMFSASNGADLRRLYDGDTSGHLRDDGTPDHSRAVWDLVCDLAWWTNHDATRTDRMFRQSRLYDQNPRKWDRLSAKTIAKALATVTGGYTGSTAPEWQPTGDGAAGIAHVVEPEPAGGAVTRRLSDVEPEPVTWLWRGWLPMGKVVVLDGDPGTGKSTITLDIAARLSRGDVMPDGSTGALHGQDAATIMVNVEDGAGDTMRPRFDAATGKPSMVHLLDAIETVTTGRDGTHRTERVPFTLPDHTAELEDLIVETGACLVVIDPLMAILSGKVQANSDQDVRRALSPLAAVADRTGACILVVRHLRKSEGGNHLYRGGGSIGIIGAARAGLVVAFDPDDETPDPAMRRRVFAVAKSNLAAIPSSQTYSIVTARVRTTREDAVTSRIAWGDTTALTAADLNRPHRDQSDDDDKPSPQVGLAMEVLRDILRDGAMPATDVYRQAEHRGIAGRTLKRAKRAAGVRAQRRGKVWFWSLPDDQKPQHSQPTGDVGPLDNVGPLGTVGPLGPLDNVGMGHMNRDGAPIGSTCGVPDCPNTATTWHPVEGWLCSDCHRDVTAHMAWISSI